MKWSLIIQVSSHNPTPRVPGFIQCFEDKSSVVKKDSLFSEDFLNLV